MRTAINSPDYHVPLAGFSQLVETTGPGRTLYLSGLTSRTATGEIVAVGDLAGQAAQVFDNLEMILAAAGAGLEHVVSIRTYVIEIEAFEEMGDVWRERWGDVWPASTMVQVTRLWDERHLIEMEAIAVLPDD